MQSNSPPGARTRWTFAQYALLFSGLGGAVVAAVFVRGVVVTSDRQAVDSGVQPAPASDSVAALRSALREHPDSTATRLRLASLLRESDPEEALQILDEIPRTDPQWIAAIRQIAILHLLAGRTDAASQSLKEVITADPENVGAQLALAELYFEQQEPQAALPHAQAAARLVPNRPETFLLIAEIQDELHNHAAMVEPLEAAIALAPEFYEAHLNLAYAHQRIGQLAEAGAQAEWCLSRNPREVAALRILASIARDEGRIPAAEELVSRALKIQPDDVDCRILQADILLYQRKPREAYQHLKEIYDAQRNTVRYLGALARAAAAAGERDEARRHYRAVDELVKQRRQQPRE